jgi:hypothetical protein
MGKHLCEIYLVYPQVPRPRLRGEIIKEKNNTYWISKPPVA